MTNLEFIIVDDGSSDNSVNIIEDYQQRDSRIVVIRNDQNLGLPVSLNKAITLAKAPYIARQDSDDVSLPNRIRLQYEFMQSHPEVDILGCDSYRIDRNGQRFAVSENDISEISNYFKSESIGALFDHGTAFIKKSLFFEIGFYDENFFYTQDLEYWARSYFYGKMFFRLQIKLYELRIKQSPEQQNDKEKIKLELGRLIRRSLQSGFSAGKYYCDPERVKKIIDKKNDILSKDTSRTSFSDYWFFVARQAFKNDKDRCYIRQCLYRSLGFKEHFSQHMLKMLLIVISYFPFGYGFLHKNKNSN